MKEFAKTFYKSKAWQQCRRSYIAKRRMIDGGVCEVCHQRIGYIVHHKEHLTPDNINDPETTLNHENLSYECKQCHDEHEGHGIKRKTNGLRIVFDEEGQPIIIPPKNEKNF